MTFRNLLQLSLSVWLMYFFLPGDFLSKDLQEERKVMPSDNNRPNRTDYSRETEPDEKKGRFCLQITTALVGLTTQERQNLVKKKGRFYLQITTAQIGLTTQERQNSWKKERFYLQIKTAQIGLTTKERLNQVNRVTKLDEKRTKNTGSSLTEIIKTGNSGLITQEHG